MSFKEIRLRSAEGTLIPIKKQLSATLSGPKKMVPTFFQGDLISARMDIFFLAYPNFASSQSAGSGASSSSGTVRN